MNHFRLDYRNNKNNNVNMVETMLLHTAPERVKMSWTQEREMERETKGIPAWYEKCYASTQLIRVQNGDYWQRWSDGNFDGKLPIGYAARKKKSKSEI